MSFTRVKKKKTLAKVDLELEHVSLGSNKVKSERECVCLLLARAVSLSHAGHIFFAVATLRSKWMLLTDLRENQMSWVDPAESCLFQML